MNENKMCPLMSVSSGDNLAPCQGERCAWYVQGRCAVQYLAALPDLAKRVGQL